MYSCINVICNYHVKGVSMNTLPLSSLFQCYLFFSPDPFFLTNFTTP